MIGERRVSRLVLASTFLFLCSSAAGGQIFRTAKDFATGGPFSNALAAGDFNGDGKLDVAVASSEGLNTTGSISILLGDGAGNFRLANTYDATGATTIAVGDLNGDGKLDIVAGDSNSDAYILLGKGDGSFNAPQTVSASGLYVVSVALADLNHDSKLDLIMTTICGPNACNTVDHVVSVLLGNGDGTFQPAVAYDAGGKGTSSLFFSTGAPLAVADVNGDGNPDILVANPDGNVGVLLGRGDGTFEPTSIFDVGSTGAIATAVADLNGDQKPDLVIAFETLEIGVLLGNGDGTFGPIQLYATTGAYPNAVAVADVNQDGKPDLLISDLEDYSQTHTSRGIVDIFLGKGDGTFQTGEHYDSGGQLGFGVLAVDLNGDKKPDLIAGNFCAALSCRTTGVIGVGLNRTLSTTTTKVSSNLNPSIHGKPVTFTATVASTGAISPTGEVGFKYGTTVFAAGKLKDGTVTVTVNTLPEGTLSIIAFYKGDTESAASSSAVLSQIVNPPAN